MTETVDHQKAVVVTGASRGLGRTLAVDLSAHGFTVFAGVRKASDGESLKEDTGGRVHPVMLDVTDLAAVKAAAAEVDDATGGEGIAGLVNNAGVANFGPVEQASMSEVERQIGVNFIGALMVTQQFLPALRKGKGRIVNVSSVNGRISIPFSGIYSATKFALEAISDALRVELEGSEISVSVVEPGATATDIRAGAMADWAARRDQLSGEERELYGESFQKLTAIIEGVDATAAGHEHISRDVLHALTSESPKTRYQTGPDWEQWAGMLTMSDEDRDSAFREMLL
jgi:NAD(P)-dependent dehydrogenase (short-subunit alcohol dehydrogenase family)